jgi:small subunit ribosomal protein S17
VHDEEGKAAVGDIVQISESRPLSKRKRWRLVEVVRKITATDGQPTEVDGGVL